MPDAPRISRSVLANAGLVAGVVVLLILAYGFFSRIASDGGGEQVLPAFPVEKAAPNDILQVEVRNATMVDGLAGQVRGLLRTAGFDVVETGNYNSRDEAHSFVIDRVGNLDQARRVARTLGIDPSRVRQEIKNDLLLDATVVIGADYASLPAFKDQD